MNKQEITIKYRTPAHVIGSTLTILLFPIWGMVGTIGSLFLSPLLLTCDPRIIFSVLLMFSLLACGLLATIVSLDHSLVLSSNGLAFPLICIQSLKGRRERSWSDLTRVRFLQRTNKPLSQGRLDLMFASGGHVLIDLQCLKDEEIEQVLLALEVWGKKSQKDPELLVLSNGIHDGQHLKGLPSFTSMWEQEMGRRFSSTAFVPLTNGKKLQNGRIEIVQQIAFGGLSAIYLAQINQTEIAVVKEFIVPDVDEDLRSKAAELFQREATLLSKLSHPQIARVRDSFVEDDRTYILLDYVPGTDLRQLVQQKGRQPASKVLNWAEQLVQVLTYLHSQDPPVIHRDLTPDNIVLTAEEKIVLIDFGAANEYIGTATGTLVGKQSFIAPEQFRGDTTTRSDIYAFGATLYFLLTACDPEPLSPSVPSLVVPEIDHALDLLVSECTAFDEAQRIKNCYDLAARLAAVKAIPV